MKRLAAILCLMLATGCFALAEHECGYARVVRENGAMPLPVMEEPPKKDDGAAWQAYTASTTAVWKPIRFAFFSEDLEKTDKYCTREGEPRPTFERPGETAMCTAGDILTDEKRRTLKNELMPKALKLHSERLMVEPLSTNLVLTRKNWLGACATFSAPAKHFKKGVANADMVMYVAAGPLHGDRAAWAIPCISLSSGRPKAGVANIYPQGIENSQKRIRMAAHEVGHALGFVIEKLSKKGITTVLSIRGVNRHVVTSSLTRQKAREHFNCPTLEGMELENEGIPGSHWERRNAREELMNPISSDFGYYSALTMAAFEDTGLYKAIWGKEEHLPWAYHAGCPFLTDKCVENGQTQYPDMFCTGAEEGYLCSSDRRGIGRCGIETFSGDLPQEYRYFASPKAGSSLFMDYCPVVQLFSHGLCHNGNGLTGNRFGPSSTCLKGRGLRIYDQYNPGDVCAEVSCRDGSVFVRYENDDTWYPCPENTALTPKKLFFTAGSIECPRHADVCSSPRRSIETSPSISLNEGNAKEVTS